MFRGGFKLPKHLKSPLHASEGEGQAAFGMGHTSPLLHESRLITGLQAGAHDGGLFKSVFLGGVRLK